MMTSAQEIYTQSVRRLPVQERLRLAALILEELLDAPAQGVTKAAQPSLAQLFGSVSLGYPTGADNESIDRDLAREYGATHEEDS